VKSSVRDISLCIICILAVVAIGGTSGLLGARTIDTWYASIKKPDWNPPNELFGPVWTLLYVLMGIGLFLIVKSGNSLYRQNALIIFGVQLTLNFFWTLIFFRWQMMGFALLNILVLLLMIALMIIAFRKVDKTAAVLQVPYAIWVSFATILNATLWYMNR
jgi:tryptophan-rich sensory protein